MSYLPPVAGNHNDLYNIEEALLVMIQDLKHMNIDVDGLFINADAGFDADHLRQLCEDHGIHLNAPPISGLPKTAMSLMNGTLTHICTSNGLL